MFFSATKLRIISETENNFLNNKKTPQFLNSGGARYFTCLGFEHLVYEL
jgi:hypothetical protein